MGASMLIAVTPAPLISIDPVSHVSAWDAALLVIDKRIDALDLGEHIDDDDIELLAANISADLDDDDDETRGAYEAAIRRRLKQAMREYSPTGSTANGARIIGYGPRDVTSLFIAGRTYWATGGPSWGDDPTDSFSLIRLIGILGFLDERIVL